MIRAASSGFLDTSVGYRRRWAAAKRSRVERSNPGNFRRDALQDLDDRELHREVKRMTASR
jgi:hypothetical protein